MADVPEEGGGGRDAETRTPPTQPDGGGGEGPAATEWDARYRAQPQLFRDEADETLVELGASLTPGTALDLGAGEGRNSLWLASRGWDVVAVDASSVALDRLSAAAGARGVHIQTVTADVFGFLRTATEQGRVFDLVVVAFVHLSAGDRARLLAAAADRVRQGGHLFVVAHHLESLGACGPPDPQRLYTESDLRDGGGDLEILRLERRHGPSDVPEHGVDVLLWARRPASGTAIED